MNSIFRIAAAVRSACLDAATRAYEEAGISGLCHEGRWEVALQAIRSIDLTQAVAGTIAADSAPTDDDPS